MAALVAMAPAALACAKGGATDTSAGGNTAGGGGTGGNMSMGGHGTGGEVVCNDGTKCDQSCVDLQTDPVNCGACGVTCVVPNAEAACVAGSCGLGSCEPGFSDCDADVFNGCEAEMSCTAGAACPTSCNDNGIIDCSDPCAPVCTVPPEACNLEDDDCDTECDNGAIAGCRVGVHRAVGSSGHYYGLSEAEATGLGNTIEVTNYFYLYSAQVGVNLQPFFRCQKGGGQILLTTATNCEFGAAPETTLGFISSTPDNCNSAALYRTRNPGSGAHFFTTSAAERDNAVNNLGYVSEGIAGYIWAAP